VTKERFKALLAEYGRLALGTYFAIFALVFAGFVVAIAAGVEVHGTLGNAGVFGAAYVATKLTQPLRILGTLLLTPLVAGVLRRLGAAKAGRVDERGANG